MFKIFIEDLVVEVIIGILKDERQKPQKVEVELEIEYEREGRFIDYAEVVEIVKELLHSQRYELLEDALEDIEKKLHLKFPEMKSLKLKLFKPEILTPVKVGVELLKIY